jgi:hypothetical protein
MDIVLNFIENRAKRFKSRKLVGLGLVSVLLILASALLVFSGMLINEIEILGVLLGSIGGVIVFFASVFAFTLFVKRQNLDNFKERFSISTRRTISIVLGILFLLLVALSGSEGNNPVIGASTVIAFGWIALFYYVTPAENEAIEAAAEEIVWAYENQNELEEEQYLEEEYQENEPYEDDDYYEDEPAILEKDASEYLKYGKDDMESFFKELETKKNNPSS